MLIKRSLSCVFIVLLASSIYAIEEHACLDPSIVAVSGLMPGMNKKSLNSIDAYIAKEMASGEDDGGYYEAKIYHYEKYDVTVIRDIIDSIRITSPDLVWAQKIKIGTDRRMVEKHITSAAVVNDNESAQYLVCSSEGDVYAIMYYHDNKIRSIELAMDRP